jgi:hypothetical protein
MEDKVAKSFVSREQLPPHIFALSEAEKQRQFEKLRMMDASNKAFWGGIAARNRELEDMGFNLWDPPVDIDQIKKETLRELATKGGRASKPDWLTSEIARIVDRHPDISEVALRKQLAGRPEVQFLDETGFSSPADATQISYAHRGGEKVIPCSGLKDRLSRAKKSRQPDSAIELK